MRLNPFAKPKPDDLQRQFDHSTSTLLTESQINPRTGISDEQIVIERQKERAELTKWQQDMTEEISTMIHRLRNEIKNPETGMWNKRIIILEGKAVDAPPICSEECIWRLVSLLEPSTSKNLMMSKYDKEYILLVLHRLADTVAIDVLLTNRKRWGIAMSDMSLIVDIFRTAADPTYFRALGANEKDYLKGIRKDTYLHTEGEPLKKKEGFLRL